MFRALARQTGWVGVGIGGGLGAILVATPFLARIHGPAEFGALALFLTASNIATALGCARYDVAIASAEQALLAPLFRICAVLAIAFGTTCILALLLMSASLPASAILDKLHHNAGLLGACMVMSALYQAESALLLRQGRVRWLAALRVAQGMGFALLGLTGHVSLIWAHTLSYLPAIALLCVISALQGPVNRRLMVETARRYSDFPRFGLPGAVFDVIGYSLCIWVVIEVFGAISGGEWSQIQRVVGAPLMLCSIAVGQVLLVQSAQHRDNRRGLRRLFLQIELAMLALLVGIVAIMAIAGEDIFHLLLGEDWHVGAPFAILVSIAVFIRAAVSPLSSILVTFRRLDLGLRWQVTYFACAVITFAWVAHHATLLQFAAFYALHETILYLIYLRLIFGAMKD